MKNDGFDFSNHNNHDNFYDCNYLIGIIFMFCKNDRLEIMMLMKLMGILIMMMRWWYLDPNDVANIIKLGILTMMIEKKN